MKIFPKTTIVLMASIFSIISFSTMTSDAFGQIQDSFPDSEISVTIEIFGFGMFDLVFSGETVVERSTNPTDTDGNGLQEIETEMVQMELTGISPFGGSMSIKAGNDCVGCPETVGNIEESVNNNPNDVEASDADPAASFFDVFYEIEIDTPQGPVTIKNEEAYCVSSSIADVPPTIEESYVHQQPPVEVVDGNGVVIGFVFGGVHFLNPTQAMMPPRDFPDNLADPCVVIVGGELLPIETTALLLAASQSPTAWLTSLTIVALGIGAYVFTRNPNNMRNIMVILRDYLNRF